MKKIILIFLLIPLVKVAIGQGDTIPASLIDPDSVTVKNDWVYKLFLEENNPEIKHLLKFNIIGINQYTPFLSYEQKIGKNFSSETSVGYKSIPYYNNYFVNIYVHNDSEKWYHGKYIGCYETLKYYYNLNRRKKSDRTINGFSGNYFALQFAGIYFKEYYDSYGSQTKHPFYYAGSLIYGLQRRIGNIGFLEPSILLTMGTEPERKTFIKLSFNIKAGFSFDSFSSLNKMHKK